MRFGQILAILGLIFTLNAHASIEKTFAFSFQDASLNKVVQVFNAQTGQKFVIEPGIAANARLTIVHAKKVNAKEAFNLMSASLALAGVAISSRDDTHVIAPAKAMERSFLPVVSELPALQPERLVTWVATLKHADAANVLQQVRMLTSKDGEAISYGQNRLMFTDWVSNLYRVRDVLQQIDKPVEAKIPHTPPTKAF